ARQRASLMKLSASSEKAPLVAPENLAPFILVTVLFFLWGRAQQPERCADWPVHEIFVLNRFQAGLVQSAFHLGYSCLRFPPRYSGAGEVTRPESLRG